MTTQKPGAAVGRVRIALIAIGLVAGSLSIGGKAIAAANRRAEIKHIAHEAHLLYDGFRNYSERTGAYPNSFQAPAFDLANGDPLRRRGYYLGKIHDLIRDRRFDGYDAPDDRGVNEEFWLEMTLASDPSVRIVVAQSDDAPLSGGEWLDGVYLATASGIERL
jgi:hypothetical protein